MWPVVTKTVKLDEKHSLSEAVALTFACGATASKGDARNDRSFHKSFAAFVRRCEVDLPSLKHIPTISGTEDATQFIRALWQYSFGRTFFITKAGRMGMGSYGIQEGDKLCHLFGGLVPFALRQDGSCWRLLGDAYVYNLASVSRTICRIVA